MARSKQNLFFRKLRQVYEHRPVYIQERASFLFVLLSFTLALLCVLLAAGTMSGLERVIEILRIITLPVLTIILAIVLLFRGYYLFSINSMLIVCSLALGFGLYMRFFESPHTAYSSLFYFAGPMVLLAAFFSTRLMVHLIAIYFLSINVVFFYFVREVLDPLSLEAAMIGFADSAGVTALMWLLSIVMVRITAGSLKRAEDASKESKDRLNAIESFHHTGKDIAEHLASSSEEMTATTESLSENILSQTASLEEITATVEEISAKTDGIARDSRTQYDLLVNLESDISALSEIIEKMRISADRTTNVFASATESARKGEEALVLIDRGIQEIHKSSEQLNSIVGIMSDFFQRINLLSLNASIEAARAGEYGRGFAVVAEEISRLSDKSAGSLKEITELVERNNSEVEQGNENIHMTIDLVKRIIEHMESLQKQAAETTELVKEQTSIRERVQGNSRTVFNSAKEIQEAVTLQKSGMDEIVQSVSTVQEYAQKNSEGAQEFSSSVKQLADMADQLNRSMENATQSD